MRCHSGCNRSGLVVAQTLTELGQDPATAIALIRQSPIFKDTDPTSCPSGGNETHRVRWNGTAVVSSPSPPHYEQANEPL